jgi:hypothetical protein
MHQERFPLIAVASALHGDGSGAGGGRLPAADGQPASGRRAVLAGYLGSALLFAAHPQMFSVLLFAIELYLLEVARTRPRVALWIPLLMPLPVQ